ncbi:MAG: uL13 family ribosomal protein, partial [Oscillospiraceae bacterium]|nr:uL13 family ribosomal protein [Oscillospiraceae bacterium]
LEQKYYRTHSGYVGGLKETKYRLLMQQKPELAVRLAVRGMMPRNIVTKDSLTRLKIYRGGEHPHAAQKPETWTVE